MLAPVVDDQSVLVVDVEPLAFHEHVDQLVGVASPFDHAGDVLVAVSTDITLRRVLGDEHPERFQQADHRVLGQSERLFQFAEFDQVRCTNLHVRSILPLLS